jgi:L-asparaginase
MSLPRIRILATGGTIAGAADSAAQSTGYRAGAIPVDVLCAAVPGLDEVAQITCEQVAAIDSKDATPAFWQQLASRVQASLDAADVDGVVITHGTDTLEESAYYLHLVIKSAKPVVLVGAMRPATSLSADGPLNLLNAVRLAAAPDASGRGVLVALNNQVFGARDVAKTNATRPDAFSAPDTGPLGIVCDTQVVWLGRTERGHTLQTPFTAATPLAQVEILLGYAGMSAALVGAVAGTGARGLVWAGPGNGSMATHIEEALGALTVAGVAVVRASRTGSGYVMPVKAGGPGSAWPNVSAGTLTPYKARVLLMLALGAGLAGGELQQAFDTY